MTILILLLAIILRLPYLNQSLWLDEAIQALALMGEKGPILDYALADFQPPLYHFVLFGWTRIAGFSEIALRTPSLIAGVLTVLVGMKIAGEVAGRKVSYIAGLLLATNPLLIYYSQEGRTYMMTAFFVTLSFYLLIKNLAATSMNGRIKYMVASVLSLWTSYLAWIAIASQGAYLYIKKRKKILAFTLLSLLTLVAWAPSLLNQLGIGLSTISHSPEWGRVVGGFELMRLPRTWIKFVVGRVSIENNYLYAAVSGGIIAYHIFLIRLAKNEWLKVLYTWLLAPTLIGLLVSLFIPVYQYFRLLFVLPAYFIILSLGVSKSSKWIIHTLLLVGVQITFLVYFWGNTRFHREDWRGLVTYIEERQEEGSALGMPSLAQDAPLRYYNLSIETYEPKEGSPKPFSTIYYLDYVEDLFDPDKTGRKNIEEAGYTLEEEKVFTGLHLYVYQK